MGAQARGRVVVAAVVAALVLLAGADLAARARLAAVEREGDELRAAAAGAGAAAADALDRLAEVEDEVAAATTAAGAAAAEVASARSARDAVEADLLATATELDAARAAFRAELTAGREAAVVEALGRCLRGVRQALVAVGVDDTEYVVATLAAASTDCAAAQTMSVQP